LQKEVAAIKFDLDAFDPLDREIQNQSMENLATLGRRGCTTDELYSLLQTHFGTMFRQILSDTLDDLSEGGKETVDEVNRIVNLTRNSITKYVGEAGEWTGEQVQNKMAERLDEWGKSVEKLSNTQKSLIKIARRINKTTFSNTKDEATSST
jgi:predicted transcriptional regulator